MSERLPKKQYIAACRECGTNWEEKIRVSAGYYFNEDQYRRIRITICNPCWRKIPEIDRQVL